MDKISFTPLGGGKEIGANCYLLDWNGERILLDCGMHPELSGYASLPSFEFINDNPPKAIIITHAHHDHIGALPIALLGFPEVKVHITEIGRSIAWVMLKDSVKLINNRLKELPRLPFYNMYKKETLKLLDSSRVDTHQFNEEFKITEKLKATFYPAGHVLGSGSVYISDGKFGVLYTGDICYREDSLVGPMQIPDDLNINIIISESTYADEPIDMKKCSVKEIEKELSGIISDIIRKGGNILFPCFALGKTQEILFILSRLMKSGRIPKVPVYVQGLSNSVTEIYNRFRRYIPKLKDEDFILFDSIYIVYNEKEKIIEEILSKPSIIIATSGMVNPDTLSFSFARKMLEKENNAIIFTGYLNHNSVGNYILKSKPGEKIKLKNDVEIIRRASIVKRYWLSSHISSKDLYLFINKYRSANCILIHGENPERFAEKIKTRRVVCPENKEEVIITINGKTVMRRSRDMSAVIVTVGTSIMTNYIAHNRDKNIKDIKKEDLIKFFRKVGPERASAEANSLSHLSIGSGEILHFICSDDENRHGEMCAEVLRDFYIKKGYICELTKVPKLSKNHREFATEGLNNLVNILANLIEKYKAVRIACTAGFKAEMAYATVIGMLYKVPVYYIHEDFKDNIELPVLALGFDFGLIENYYDIVLDVLYSTSDDESKKLLSKLPTQLQSLFYKDRVIDRYVLKPLGVAVKRAYEDYLYKKALIKDRIKLKIKYEIPGLWQGDRKYINDITSNHLRDLILCLSYKDFLVGVVFDRQLENDNKRDGLYYKNNYNGEVIYRLNYNGYSQLIIFQVVENFEKNCHKIIGNERVL